MQSKSIYTPSFILGLIFFSVISFFYLFDTSDIFLIPRQIIVGYLGLILTALLAISGVFKGEISVQKPMGLLLLGLALVACYQIVGLGWAFNKGEVLSDFVTTTIWLNFGALFWLIFKREDVKAQDFFKIVVILAIAQCGVAFLQVFGIAFYQFNPQNEFCAFLGNRNVMGTFIVLSMPAFLYLLLGNDRVWQIVSGIGLGVALIALLLTETRAAWGAAGLATVVALVFIFVKAAKLESFIVRRVALRIGATAGIGLLVVVGTLSTSYFEVLRGKILDRVASLVTSGDANESNRSLTERQQISGATLQVISEQGGAIGVGAGNWKIHVGQYGSDGFGYKHGNKWLRTHNIYLQTLAEEGFVGFAFFLLFLVGLVWLCIAALRAKEKDRLLQNCLLVPFILVLLIIEYFSFTTERVVVIVFWMAMIGLLANNIRLENLQEKKQKHDQDSFKNSWNVNARLFWLVPILLIASLKISHDRLAHERNLKITKDYYNAARNVRAQGKQKLAIKGYRLTVQEGKKEMGKWMSLSALVEPVELFIGNAYLEMNQTSEAVKYFEKGKKLAPYSSGVTMSLGTGHFMNGDKAKAEKYYKESIALAHNFVDARTNLAIILKDQGRYDEALEVVTGLDLPYQPNMDKLKKMEDTIREEKEAAGL